MANSPGISHLSVADALSIRYSNKCIMTRAVQEIREKCNMPNTNATFYKVKKKLNCALDQRKEAIRRGKIAAWRSKTEQEQFC